jgi:hypothetical protein
VVQLADLFQFGFQFLVVLQPLFDLRLHLPPDAVLLVRIPLKWGTDSGEVGQRRSEATLVMPIMSDVPQLSQEISD